MSSLDRIIPFLMPIQYLLVDPAVTEVMVNAGGRRIFAEKDGLVGFISDCRIEEKALRVAIKNIARTCGDDISEDRPILDARLEDGSRIAAVFPPCSVDGPTLAIRRFGQRYSLQHLVDRGSLSIHGRNTLLAAVSGRKNILISGGGGTGKTTLLNALAAMIPGSDRIALIEDTSEIVIDKPNIVRLEARKETPAAGHDPIVRAITISELLRATLRLRPDRIILGEVRGVEAFDLLQALNTGHQGSLSTIHANSAKFALRRLARLSVAADLGLTLESAREDVADSIQIVVHIERVNGVRKVAEILDVSEVHHA